MQGWIMWYRGIAWNIHTTEFSLQRPRLLNKSYINPLPEHTRLKVNILSISSPILKTSFEQLIILLRSVSGWGLNLLERCTQLVARLATSKNNSIQANHNVQGFAVKNVSCLIIWELTNAFKVNIIAICFNFLFEWKLNNVYTICFI